MGNVLKAHRKESALTLVRAQHSFRDIEERLGICRGTVSKYAVEAELWPPPKPATLKVEQFGFTHRYNSVKRYVRCLKKKDPEQYDRLEFLPGEEAQVDYGLGAIIIHPNTDKRRRPRLFVMSLRYSRRSFRKVIWNSSQEAWARLHEEAFRCFGGCPQYVVLDNLGSSPDRVGDLS